MRRISLAVAVVLSWSSSLAAAAGAGGAHPVSPGVAEGVARVAARCPTFSWSAAPGAEGYEVAVYVAGDDGLQLFLRQAITGAALSWTPDVGRCLEHGRLYGWAVRAAGGGWSAVRLFRVVDRPSAAEVSEALAVLRRLADAEAAAKGASAEAERQPAELSEGDAGALRPRPSAAARQSAAAPSPGARVAAAEPRARASAPAVTPGGYSLSLSGDVSLGGQVFKGGQPFLHDHGGEVWGNTGIGRDALGSVAPRLGGAVRDYGHHNTAVGSGALADLVDGNYNTAVGVRALESANLDGGDYADSNVAVGREAMAGLLGGSSNVAVGSQAMRFAGPGHSNVAVGPVALLGVEGSGNIAIGSLAGHSLETGSDNVYIGHSGATSESGVVRIGDSTVHTRTSLAGDVGIGTEQPGTRFHVVGAIDGAANLSNHVARIQNAAPTTTQGPDVLALQTSAATPTGATNFVTFYNGSGSAVGRIEGDGAGGVTLVSGGADFAELLPRLRRDEALAPGDVVGLFGGRVGRATDGAEALLVVTTRPLVLGAHPGEDADTAAYAPVALLGQVPVRVTGAVAPGDVLVASGAADGTARAVRPEALAAADLPRVVGTALEAHPADGPGRARALVGVLPAAPLARVVAREAAELERRLRRLEAAAGAAIRR